MTTTLYIERRVRENADAPDTGVFTAISSDGYSPAESRFKRQDVYAQNDLIRFSMMLFMGITIRMIDLDARDRDTALLNKFSEKLQTGIDSSINAKVSAEHDADRIERIRHEVKMAEAEYAAE